MPRARQRVLAIAAAGALSPAAVAGPPLVTDDTGMLNPGGWELILFATADLRDSADTYALPAFEANYGLTAETMATASVGRVAVDVPGEDRRSAVDAMTTEFKWLVHSGPKTAVTLVPAYSFPVTDSSTDRGLVGDVRVLALPVVASYQSGQWQWHGQLSYEIASSGPQSVFAGLLGGYSVTPSLQLLAEVYSVDTVGQASDEVNWNVGVDWTFSGGWALIASAGGGLRSDFAPADELDTAVYVGLRLQTP